MSYAAQNCAGYSGCCADVAEPLSTLSVLHSFPRLPWEYREPGFPIGGGNFWPALVEVNCESGEDLGM